ncbi:SCP2 sterol-binding domain-containing protein [Streptomyces aidingensis]|uniref:SCP-2 sterol transfer family protein n=1 Tax=Streptomyces aidingensis TaxID=910347 RepID=A0A1I1K7S6_9ACTN|nr:SCP2 sterol-binding domain-containing protein [Streptomyces aidingensis]SFC54768.1 SCP-2 sterol transfer family protein [Streptomyces aidingensis]
MADNADADADLLSRLDGMDFAAVAPEEFARLVKGLSTKDIAEVMTGERRLRVLRAVFSRMERQFRPDRAGSLRALIRWQVGGDTEAVYEVSIADGGCAAREGRTEADARTTLTLGDAEFLRLVSGNANPITLFMTRRLKVAGDIGLASGLTRLFDIPKA